VLGAAQVVAFTEVHNSRSRTVMERVGMAYDREIHRPGLVAGTPGLHPGDPTPATSPTSHHEPIGRSRRDHRCGRQAATVRFYDHLR
jgi:RimJ/RimL family protein N-acetyltransferase